MDSPITNEGGYMDNWNFKHFTRETLERLPKKTRKYKNYRELCEKLGLEVKQGNSKVSQLKELECFATLEKEGRTFIVQRRDSVLKKEDGRESGNRVSPYMDDLKVLIMKYIHNQKSEAIFISSNLLLENIGMFNQNYRIYNRNYVTLSSVLEVSETIASNIVGNLSSIIRSNFDTAIKSLSKSRLIEHSEVYVMRYNNDIVREATDYEVSMIMFHEKKYLKDHDFASIQDAFIHRKYYDMYSYIARSMNIVADIYKTNKFIHNEDLTEKYLSQQELSIDEVSSRLNTSFLDKMTENAINRFSGYGYTMEEGYDEYDHVLSTLSFLINKKINNSNVVLDIKDLDSQLPF